MQVKCSEGKERGMEVKGERREGGRDGKNKRKKGGEGESWGREMRGREEKERKSEGQDSMHVREEEVMDRRLKRKNGERRGKVGGKSRERR